MAGFSPKAFDELRAFVREQGKKLRAWAAGSRPGKTFLGGASGLRQTLKRWAASPVGQAIGKAWTRTMAAVDTAWSWVQKSPIGQAMGEISKAIRKANAEGDRLLGKKTMRIGRLAAGYALLFVVAPLGFLVPIPAPVGLVPAIVGLTLIVHDSPWAQKQIARLRDRYPDASARMIATSRKFLPNLTAEFEALTNPDTVLGPKGPDGKRRPPAAKPPILPPAPPPTASLILTRRIAPVAAPRPTPKPTRRATPTRRNLPRFTP